MTVLGGFQATRTKSELTSKALTLIGAPGAPGAEGAASGVKERRKEETK